MALVVIDPLANVLPGADENGAAAMIAALAPLQRLTAAGLAVLLLHHPRKDSKSSGPEPRGSGALPGFVDVLIDLDGPRVVGDRRRRLRAVSRFEETPGERLIELSADGTDYTVIADAGSEEFDAGWAILRMVLEDARNRLTRREVLALWPPDFPKPCDATVWRWLERAVESGHVSRQGTGRRNLPFQYWMPEREQYFSDVVLEPLPELEPLRVGPYGQRGKESAGRPGAQQQPVPRQDGQVVQRLGSGEHEEFSKAARCTLKLLVIEFVRHCRRQTRSCSLTRKSRNRPK